MAYERKNIRSMQGYTPGEQPRDDSTIKLNTNENPWPPAREIQEIISAFRVDDLRRYPPPTADQFRDRAASLHDVAIDNIIATRGGDELLRLLITTFADPGEIIATTDPTYSLYPVLAQIQDCPVIRIPLNNDWSLPSDFARQANDAGSRLTLLVNPHAPSGRLLDVATLSGIADELDSVLLIDEAYADFADREYNAIPLIEEHDNVVILRTLSKGYSLAGLRFGYGIGAPSLISPMLTKTRDSYNLDLFSQLIATAALSHREHAMQNCRRVIEQRQQLTRNLTESGLFVEPSETNFLLVTVPPHFPCTARMLYETLKARGILIRYFSEPRLEDKVRITVGTPEENLALMTEIQQAVWQ